MSTSYTLPTHAAPLAKPLRTQLENTVKAARDTAENGARAALTQLAVGEGRAPDYLTDDQKALRRRLRAHGRALGDAKAADDTQALQHLVWEVAYEHWHRMLFARFLAENGLLMWEMGAAVSLDDCAALVQDPDPQSNLGAKTQWDLAGKLAARMLPQVFKPHSPVFEIAFAPEHQRMLERLLAGLASDVFQASDSLGWVYQFWQAKRKKDINDSEVKIGADELPAVTQLFTEPYMVDFLLHNSLGAWWHTRHGQGRPGQPGQPAQPTPVPLTYLRMVDDGTPATSEGAAQVPAAGQFEGWPDSLKDFKLLDPCCGSGHFLVAAFLLLVPMRMAAEGLTAVAAVDAVLQDNLHGLELDPRCVEIAVFALALTAWRYPDEDGNPLGVRAAMPAPQVACCGLQVAASADDWVALIPNLLLNKEQLAQEIRGLHADFMQSPLLGSLLDPSRSQKYDLAHSQYGNSFDALRALMAQALARESVNTANDASPAAPAERNDDAWNVALNARGLFDAARLLDARYHLVVTNVPYLARGKQNDTLKNYCATHYPDAKNDLANVFLERCLELCRDHGQGVVQIVMPQNWLFLTSFRLQREELLKNSTWNFVALLGPKGFQTPMWDFNVQLLTLTHSQPTDVSILHGLDVSAERAAQEKATALLICPIKAVIQTRQLGNPSSRISFHGEQIDGVQLKTLASALAGCTVGDLSCFVRQFWEVPVISADWEFHQVTPSTTTEWDGRHEIILWEGEIGAMFRLAQSVRHLNHVAQNWLRGKPNWKKRGVVISLMGNIPVTLYGGERYAATCTSLVLNDQSDVRSLLALWTFCKSDEFLTELKKLSQKISIEVKTILEVPFNVEHWATVAAEQYPDGLPKPYSDDLTQWLFHGHPQPATDPLHVAVARLVGYRWPAEQQAAPTVQSDELQAKSPSSPLETCASSYQNNSVDLPAPAPTQAAKTGAAAMELSDEAHAWIARCAALAEHTDDDGIVCLPSVRGEPAAHDRLLQLLIAAWETVQPGSWKPAVLDKLLADADCAGKGLDTWLRDKFFEQHAKRFHHRPFVWQVWDGLKDGFAALVNYHQLDAKNLERLIHTYLGDWIRQQEVGIAHGVDGAQLRWSAAQDLKRRLQLIQEGESSGKTGHDIFVRWKPLAEQPIGWTPDLNDGVRLNIRPFMAAEVLRHNKKPKLNITWDKDRGKDVESAPWFGVFGGERINDHHLTLAEKMAARKVNPNES